MARPRKTSAAVTKADTRIIGMNGITPGLDLGDGVSVATVTAKRDETKALQERHNALASELSIVGNQLTASEKALNTLNSRVLTLVRGRFGVDSDEYERVGGVRQSERKRTPRRPAGAPG
jgi:hypothetical protein